MGIDSETFHLIENSQTTLLSTVEYKKQIQNNLIPEWIILKNANVEKGIKQLLSFYNFTKLKQYLF